jgi:hypothetical protein
MHGPEFPPILKNGDKPNEKFDFFINLSVFIDSNIWTGAGGSQLRTQFQKKN